MTYFSTFPQFRYPLETYQHAVKDITLRNVFKKSVLDNIFYYDEYIITDIDTPEIISHFIYGSPYYHWLILMANDIVDPFFDWPLPDYVFNTWVEEKYAYLNTTGNNGELLLGADKTKYWINEEGIVVNEELGTYPISHRLYEDLLNNKKRNIKIIKPELLNDVIAKFEELIKL